MLKDIVDELPIHVFNADEREKEYHELYGITNEIFTEVMKERKLKKLKIDKEMIRIESYISTAVRPCWIDDRGRINEVLFCQRLLDRHPMRYIGDSLYSIDGRISYRDMRLPVYNSIKQYVSCNVNKMVSALIDVLCVRRGVSNDTHKDNQRGGGLF